MMPAIAFIPAENNGKSSSLSSSAADFAAVVAPYWTTTNLGSISSYLVGAYVR